MAQSGDRPRFSCESRAARRVGRRTPRQDLDRDVTIQSRVVRPIHFAHATGANEREDLVRAEPGAGLERHRHTTMMGDGTMAR
jgi:hypothetical protein